MQPETSQVFESYLPVYDAVPDKWDDAQEFLAERLKEIANAVNAREIGFFIDELVLSGKAFIPSAITQGDASPNQFRQVLRKVFDVGPLSVGLNTINHYIVVDANFTNLGLKCDLTNSTAFTGKTIEGSGTENITYTATTFLITVSAAYDRAFVTWEFCQEP